MERNFYNDDFEEFLKQKADQYKLYPSERVWSNVYSSLHSRRRWFTVGLLLLLITSTLIVSREIFLSNYARVAQKVNESISQTSAANTSFTTISATESPVIILAPNKPTASSLNTGRSHLQKINDISNSSLPNNTEDAYNDETSVQVIENGSLPSGNEFDYTGKTNLSEATRIALALPLPALTIKKQRNNKPAIQNDDAAPNIAPEKNKWNVQLYASPIVSYRRLSNLNRNSKYVPVAINFDNNIDNYVRHKPAIGFELGTKVQYNVSNSLSFYAGAQLNYSRYYIDAYNYHAEKASIALNNSSPIADTVSNYTSIRNFDGYYPEQLQNQYFQLSVPIGAELKLLGSKRLQFSIAASVQPTYLISSNSYLLSSDYKNYIQNPDLARKFNVHTNFEAFVSYKMGGLKWQLGPQFRYQLLSSYTNDYGIREYLTEFGFKLGVSKTIK